MDSDSSDEVDHLSLLGRIRRHHRRVGRQLYRQWRVGLTIAAPLFILVGLLELAGLVYAGGAQVNRPLSSAALIILGALLAAARLTWFRGPPGNGRAA